ncbi:MAG TPA: Holliday junction resolvase RuvX [Ktedonobacterales bacterium]|nr:Holliday junction resolvase RuvX [Ktedonobacterales bacterium]
MVILGLDLGAVRIGYATSDPGEQLATPRGVIKRRSTAQALDAVVRIAREVEAELVVVGLPISLDGGLHGQAKAVQAFAERLRTRLNLPLVYQDERLSTVTAAEALRAAGVRPERIRERLDAAAAAVILRDFLDQRQVAGTSGSVLGGSLPEG